MRSTCRVMEGLQGLRVLWDLPPMGVMGAVGVALRLWSGGHGCYGNLLGAEVAVGAVGLL